MKYFILILFPLSLVGQFTSIPNHSDLARFAERMEIKGYSDYHCSLNSFSPRALSKDIIASYDSLSPVDRYMAIKTLRSYPEFHRFIASTTSSTKKYIDSTKTFYSTVDAELSELELAVQDRKPILKYFYKNPNQMAVVKTTGFLLKVNPILLFGAGPDFGSGNFVFENRRGISLSGHIDDRVYFYSDIVESQARFPNYVDNFITKFQAIPGFGFYKFYQSEVFDDLRGYDFLNANAYLNARVSRNINVEFGNGRNFLGNGVRSLLMSDFTNNFLYLKFNTKIWKIHYQNLFTEFIPISIRQNPTGTIIPRKYSASHYLSFKHRGFEIGLFESIIFTRDGKFDLQYLNPVILYRLVEYNLDSSDNVLIGINAKLNLARKFQLYGQLIMDEFKLNELFVERDGWWANKFGIQAGVKYLDALSVEGLDLQIEYNRVRPFTYGHRSPASFTHANQPVAHPIGANFSEFIAHVHYPITPKLTFSSKNYFIVQGLDTDSTFYGANLLISSTQREEDNGHFTGQGNLSRTLLSVNKLSYEIAPNYFLDLNLTYRDQTFAEAIEPFSNLILSGAIRVNFWEPELHF